MKYRIISLIIGSNLLFSLLLWPLGDLIASGDFRLHAQTATSSNSSREMSSNKGETHIVQKGETLSEIAEAYDISMLILMDINNIADPDDIYFDQILYLPQSDSQTLSFFEETTGPVIPIRITPTATQQPLSPRATATPEISGQTPALIPSDHIATLNQRYTVARDDTIDRIAFKMGIDLTALREINNLTYIESYRLSIGQTLIIPATREELRVKPPVQEYIVAPGDSLGTIAEVHDISLAELLSANGITSPDALAIGQQLIIPGKDVTPDGVQEVMDAFEASYSGFYYHKIKPADTLSELAETFDSTIPAILTYNSINSIARIISGMELRIPFGPPPTPLRTPLTPASGTEFLVSLSRQQCWVFQGDRVAREWRCSTGYDDWATHTGTFAVKTKLEMAESSAHRLDMPYWLGIYDVGEFENGIHGLPVDWDSGEKLWTGLIGQPATFGCAMLVDEDAANLFELAYLGMPVHIID